MNWLPLWQQHICQNKPLFGLTVKFVPPMGLSPVLQIYQSGNNFFKSVALYWTLPFSYMCPILLNILFMLFISATIEGILLIPLPHLPISSDRWEKTTIWKRSIIAANWKKNDFRRNRSRKSKRRKFLKVITNLYIPKITFLENLVFFKRKNTYPKIVHIYNFLQDIIYSLDWPWAHYNSPASVSLVLQF